MSSRTHKFIRAAVCAALVVSCAVGWSLQARAQSDDVDPEVRIQQLESQLRKLTGQNEELQYHNQQLEERLRALQNGAQQSAPGQPPMANTAVAPPVQPAPEYQQPPSVYQQQPGGYPQPGGAPAPIAQDPGVPSQGGRRRGDAFDPNQNPNAPGVPRALGGGQLPVPAGAAPGPSGAQPPRNYDNAGAAATLPPSASPRDEFDLGVGYIERKDYGLAEETMRNFTRKYPGDPLVAEAQFWLGESFFQRQNYREAAEAFLSVTTKYDKSSKAPDALLRLGQSLAALKEKEAACAAFGEVARKFPRAGSNLKKAVEREQKRVKC